MRSDADQSATENDELLRTLDGYEMIETHANL
jgi:hypothetical protein